MSQKVLLSEGGCVSVHSRIKDMCKTARNSKGLTNQDICDLICERFGLEDFSINTVNNFFSDRSKATTIYTTGYICAVLDISIDAFFGIESSMSSEEEAEFVRQLADIKTELRFNEQQIANLEEHLREKDLVIQQAHAAIDHYRKESEQNIKKVQPWVFTSILVLLICALLFIAVYLIIFDFGNPSYGIFRSAKEIIQTLRLMA